MGVSAVGNSGPRAGTVRHALPGAVLAMAGLVYLYGPPLTPAAAQGALEECNRRTGSTYRDFLVRWHTVTVGSADLPHWSCYNLRHPTRPGADLGWWVDL